jgi:SAM-dependent methyltransferase
MNGVTVFEQNADDYDRWYDEHESVYKAEIDVLRRFVPREGLGVDVGSGTGRFSMPFAVAVSVEPAMSMARIAKKRGVPVVRAMGESLPFGGCLFDFALLVAVLCFVESVPVLFDEIGRILKPGGRIIIGFIDRDSPLGQYYESRRDSSTFYRKIRFYTVSEIVSFLREAGFAEFQTAKAVFDAPYVEGEEIPVDDCPDAFLPGFTVVSAEKSRPATPSA